MLEEKRQGLAYGWDTGKGGPRGDGAILEMPGFGSHVASLPPYSIGQRKPLPTRFQGWTNTPVFSSTVSWGRSPRAAAHTAAVNSPVHVLGARVSVCLGRHPCVSARGPTAFQGGSLSPSHQLGLQFLRHYLTIGLRGVEMSQG